MNDHETRIRITQKCYFMRSQHYTEHSQAYNYCFTLTRNHYAKTTKKNYREKKPTRYEVVFMSTKQGKAFKFNKIRYGRQEEYYYVEVM